VKTIIRRHPAERGSVPVATVVHEGRMAYQVDDGWSYTVCPRGRLHLDQLGWLGWCRPSA
jgi:hypothetical protein